MSKNKSNESAIGKFIGRFFDSYRDGIEKSFYDKAKKRDPELALKASPN
jgi:hypothetical protein